MQPAFIRLVDNLRKQLEQSTWKGSYEETDVWAEGTSDEVKATVLHLRSQLATASANEVGAIEQALAQLPSPYPGYQLHLQQHNCHRTIDLWGLCYQICFEHYDATTGMSSDSGHDSSGVKIDSTLFDETGDIDWHALDHKTQRIVAQVFLTLPESPTETNG